MTMEGLLCVVVCCWYDLLRTDLIKLQSLSFSIGIVNKLLCKKMHEFASLYDYHLFLFEYDLMLQFGR